MNVESPGLHQQIGAFHLYLAKVKRIIFTVTNDLSFDQRMHRICSSLAEAGYDIELIGLKRRSSLPLSALNFRRKRLNCWFQYGKLFYAEYNLRLFIYLLFKKTDCICAIDLDTTLPCYFSSKIKRVKRVLDAHEYFSELDEVTSRPIIYKFWHWLEKIMIPRFKSGYTVCQSLSDEFKKIYNVNFKVIRNVPALNRTFEPKQISDVLLYQGAVNKGRGLDKLVLAMNYLDIPLWVIGDGNYMQKMKQVAAENGLNNKIIFFGMMSPDELKRKTAEALIAINPFEKSGLNQYLSLSNKFFDYIHAEIPQVTMNYPEYKRINDQFEIAFLIDDLEPATIAKFVQRLLDDKEKYFQLKKNCKKAKNELNWQLEKQRLLEFYSILFNE